MKFKLFCLVVAFQACWAIGTVAIHESRLHSATVIRLDTQPVDPSDPLRGDYVVLRYGMSVLDKSLFTSDWVEASPNGTPVYVALGSSNGFYRPTFASFQPIPRRTGWIGVQGQVATPGWLMRDSRTPTKVWVDYGIERYYVHEGTGNPNGKLTVDAAVGSDGKLAIREVYLNGVPYAQAMGK
ncbi:MAG TPA: GDYXXLXY domain-containing protein [Candidatus Limnocylindria bacterium]|jgi:uncharacterized membrane-anchored protein|nr:GDYXXLXY domain-containing protein [Candidatus Limnocylindria bacterium]